MKNILILIIILLSFSCNSEYIEKSKFREKNPVEKVIINLKSGVLKINGWHEQFIDIVTEKKIFSGIKSDIIFLETSIESNQNEKKLLITAIEPQRVNGSIDFIIYLPYSIHNLSITVDSTEVVITNFPGNLSFRSESGSLSHKSYGAYTYINTNTGNINVELENSGNSDIIINNFYGNTNIKSKSFINDSNINISSITGEIFLELDSKKINPISVHHSDKFLYSTEKYQFYHSTYNDKMISINHQSHGNSQIFISNEKGIVIIK